MRVGVKLTATRDIQVELQAEGKEFIEFQKEFDKLFQMLVKEHLKAQKLLAKKRFTPYRKRGTH